MIHNSLIIVDKEISILTHVLCKWITIPLHGIKHCCTLWPTCANTIIKLYKFHKFEDCSGIKFVIFNGIFNFYYSGLWSLLAVAVFVQEYDPQSLCNVHATFEGLCYCNLQLPCLVSNSNIHLLIDILNCM